jgi:hypothetical protein
VPNHNQIRRNPLMLNGMDEPTQISFTNELEISFGFDAEKFKLKPLGYHHSSCSTSASVTSTLTTPSTVSMWHTTTEICSHALAYEVKITPELPEWNQSKLLGALIHKRVKGGEAEKAVPPCHILVTKEVMVTSDLADGIEEEII